MGSMVGALETIMFDDVGDDDMGSMVGALETIMFDDVGDDDMGSIVGALETIIFDDVGDDEVCCSAVGALESAVGCGVGVGVAQKGHSLVS
jgi:hypothetical protein